MISPRSVPSAITAWPRATRIDLSALLTGYTSTQQNIDHFVKATTVNGSAVIEVDTTGSGKAADFHAVVSLDHVGTVDIHALIASHGLIV